MLQRLFVGKNFTCLPLFTSRRNYPGSNFTFPIDFYENKYVLLHQRAREKVSPDFHKQTTGLNGLYVNENPHKDLRLLYHRILRVIGMIPDSSQYRMAVEEIVKHRLSLVEAEPDIQKLEQKIGMGQIEEVVQQAEYELECIRLFVAHKCWEPLVEKADEAQWRWPIGPGP
ncbi:hypothetical protein niasHT_004824 [Heterodera trifolii]|uniref:Uncharacterized protein n=1 Tax=Heterodera trifolii TaxID=157864 RepID=A0ABD2M9N8_9BILA